MRNVSITEVYRATQNDFSENGTPREKSLLLKYLVSRRIFLGERDNKSLLLKYLVPRRIFLEGGENNAKNLSY